MTKKPILGPLLTAGLHYRGLHIMELLIAHQVNKGVPLKSMKIVSYLPAGRCDLVVDDEIVVTRYTAIHYMEDTDL